MEDSPQQEPAPTRGGDKSQSDSGETPEAIEFDCGYCEETIETASMSGMKDRGRMHLKDHHYREIEDVFREKYTGRECRGGCGTKFPAEERNRSGFDCPTCGHNHFPQFAGRYIWWRVEVK